ncbi:MAG: NAD(P)/FAD-dependent oxidoreductase [Acetobacter sp.]|nr:NAD(P)/FAD-dependent oxidoreductase [Bacteroides sp.]MCM1340614.1 NAD(P)/FAD-dependent oxidoreductase [Acetobacter sp.]MCM1433726.1 NAD(P)/FAD-dependent oxidoreductase [Clostridiales bacterium]
MKNIVIIGAGAAGLLCGAKCALNGNNVMVIEKMPRPARKLMITGKGRCNVTNACFELDELIDNVPTNPRFLYSAFSSFMPYDTMALFEELGVPLKIERGNRVFPVSDKAVDIVDALVGYCKNSGAKIIHGAAKSFELKENKITSVLLDNGSKIACDAVAVCTGGKSYSQTGSSGDGYMLARSVGHTVTPIKPSLVPLVCSNNFIPKLQGLSLKNISVSLYENDKEIYSDFGEMIFTHYGMSGPVILSASSHIRNIGNKNYRIKIDLKPALDEYTLDKRIQRDFAELSNKDFINSLSKLLPKKLIPVIVLLSGISPDEKVNQITKEQRLTLVKLIKNFDVGISGFRSVEEAIITSGGVNVKEIDPKTMKSKIIDNLYFAGEVIDVDAYTGGFNLQIAFSTANLCAENM